MGSNFTGLTVTWYNEGNSYASTYDLTSDVMAIPLFTDTGSGEVNECELVLSAKGGKYITTGVIIDKFDRIRIEISDLGSSSYDRYFEVTDIIPTQTKTEGSQLTLSCVGIEYNTKVIHYARRDWFENAFDVAQKIGECYEANNGSRQPTLARHTIAYSAVNEYGNDLPKWTNNHYEFGASEESCYNRWMDLTTLLGGAVTNGGVGDFYELGFDTPGVNDIDMAIFTSGKRQWDGNNPANDALGIVIENTTSINVSEQEGGIANPTGTKSAAWGSPVHGSLPLGFSKYAGHELEFAFRPQWQTSTLYLVGAKVIDVTTSKHYECNTEHTSHSSVMSGDLATKWTLIDMSSEFGDTIQYSPWTDDKAVLWANAGVNPDAVSTPPSWATAQAYTIGDILKGTGSTRYLVIKKHTSGVLATDLNAENLVVCDNALLGNGAGFFDSNVVVRDDGVMFRTWVNEVIGDTTYSGTKDQDPSVEYKHSDLLHNPTGHRILNVSAVAGALTGNDNRGKAFIDAVCSWSEKRAQGEGGQWEVLYEQPTSTLNHMQVFDMKDRKIWEWNDSTSEWEDKTTDGNYRSDECCHEWKSICNVQGSDPRPAKTSTTPFNEDSQDYDTNKRSAVEVCYEFGTVGNVFVSSSADAKKGAWINFAFPFPLSSYNGISEGVGDIYGGGTNEGSNGITEPSLLDTQNMTWTSDGKIGFNHTTSEELGPISTMSFNMRVLINDANGGAAGGIAQVRCFMIDTKDNIVIQDYDMKFTDALGPGRGFQSVNLPISGFTAFRGRVPKTWDLRFGSLALGIEIPIQELDVQDVFNFHSIKYIGFQVQDFYDDEGRFDPQRELQEFTNVGTMVSLGGTIRMAVDAFHFKKVLLAISGQPSVQNIEPEFIQRPNIMSYTQLKNEVNSELEIEQFRHKEFNFQTSGNSIFNIRFGDTFFLKNTELVSDADYTETTLGAGDGTAGTVRLVAKRIEYHLTKPTSGPGGITRSIKGVKRFEV